MQVCWRLRHLLIGYQVYKARLDAMLRRKRLNNYMELSEEAVGERTEAECSEYYKHRLHQYIYK